MLATRTVTRSALSTISTIRAFSVLEVLYAYTLLNACHERIGSSSGKKLQRTKRGFPAGLRLN